MAVSPDVLIGPRLKVKRAYCHIDELIAKTSPLSKEWYSVRVQRHIVPPNAQPSGFALRYLPLEPIAEMVALIIGDTVHNLRGALDHLATGIRNSSKWKSTGHFPMRQKRKDLISKDGTPIEDLEAIEAALFGSVDLILDKIRPTNGANEPFWAFHVLDNDDKHNLILPTITVASITNINARFGGSVIQDCGMGGDATKPMNIVLSAAPIAIDNNFYASVDIKFGKGTPFENEPVIPTLTQIAAIVTDTLDQFESLIRKAP
ncbi:MAG: hypothetical protein ACK5SX_05540 [Sandaracinobacter sp.]